jgi:DNA-binding transcriptional LysR family regulator
MNLKQIEVFRAVMITGSMVGGAKLLRVSQPAVSQIIGLFERQIGLQLFRRHNGKIYATPEADILFAETERVYAGVKTLERLAEGLHHNKYGTLRIAGFPAISRQVLPRIISEYCRDRPDLDVTLDSIQSRNISDLLARRDIDLALSVIPSDRDEIDATVVGTLKAVCILPRTHPLRDNVFIHARDLEGEAFISLGKSDPSRLIIDKVFEDLGVQRRLHIETTQSDIACGFVAEDNGTSLIDELTMAWYNDDRIIALPFEPEVSFKIWLLQLRTADQPLLVRTFAELLSRQLPAYLS